MGLFLKLFETTAEYNAYTADTANFILPNVSCAMDDLGTVHYNPLVVVSWVGITASTATTAYLCVGSWQRINSSLPKPI